MTSEFPEIDGAAFRNVLGHFLAGVTIITTIDPETGTPAGLAASSFTSVSMDPPLVLFCAGSHSSTWPKIEASGSYCVNILAEDNEWMSRQFSTKVPDKFAGVTWRPGPSGSPIIEGALAYIDCTLHQVVPAGDHVLAIGRVLELGASEQGGPLAYYRGSYGKFVKG